MRNKLGLATIIALVLVVAASPSHPLQRRVAVLPIMVCRLFGVLRGGKKIGEAGQIGLLLEACQRGRWSWPSLTLRSSWSPSPPGFEQGRPRRPCLPRAVASASDQHGRPVQTVPLSPIITR